jgi:Transposase IS4
MEAQLKNFWRKKAYKVKHPLVRALFGRDLFMLMYRCFRFAEPQLGEIEGFLQEQMKHIWVPATAAVVDESMIATKSRSNPHHIFIMRKPHPHGIKFWSLVDMSGYMVSFSVYRRIVDGVPVAKETASETLLRMSENIEGKGTVITANSYFGGLDSLRTLSARGYSCLFSCNQSRPSSLFRDYMCKNLQKGESKNVYGQVEGEEEGEVIPFLVNTFESKGRKINTLSTVYSPELTEKRIEALIQDMTIEDQCNLVVEDEEQPQVRIACGQMMDFVDRCDQAVFAGLYPNRKDHWSQSLLFWLLTLVLLNNCLKLYVSATENLSITPSRWKDCIVDVLAGLPSHFDATATKHPPANKGTRRGSAIRRCQPC